MALASWDCIKIRHYGVTNLNGVVVVVGLAREEWWLSGATGG